MLFEHQKSGIEFLKKTGKAILADEMGLGKSRQAIMAAGETSESILVVCPASLKINWKREIEMVYPGDMIEILGSGQERMAGATWHIINYDIVDKRIDYINQLIEEKGVDTLILDEAHYIKGKSIRAAAIVGGSAKKKSNGEEVKIKHDGIASRMKQIYILTGTPILNRPIELFNLLKAIGHQLARNRQAYSKRYCDGYLKTIVRRYGPLIRYWDESGASNLEELKNEISDVLLRRKKSDVLDLPEKMVQVMECEMDYGWRKTYDTAFDSYIEFLKANPIDGKNIDNIIMARHLVEIMKLKQVCSRSKIDRIVQDTENAIESGEKVIIFTQFKNTLEELREKLKEIKVDDKKIGVATLSGEDKMDARQKAVDDFQNKENVKVFIANIKAGGVGITLTKASIVMFADMDWSPEIHRQAEDRAHRIGQNGTVNVYYYICEDTIEVDIAGILNSKKNIADRILEGQESDTESAGREFLRIMSKKSGCA